MLTAVTAGASPIVSLVTPRVGSPRRCWNARYVHGGLREELSQHDSRSSVQGKLKLEIHTVFGPIVTQTTEHKAVDLREHLVHRDLRHGNLRLGLEIRALRLASRSGLG